MEKLKNKILHPNRRPRLPETMGSEVAAASGGDFQHWAVAL